jgi:hypothetical protein
LEALTGLFMARARPNLTPAFFADFSRPMLVKEGVRDFLARLGAANFDLDGCLRVIFAMIRVY